VPVSESDVTACPQIVRDSSAKALDEAPVNMTVNTSQRSMCVAMLTGKNLKTLIESTRFSYVILLSSGVSTLHSSPTFN
jgi:hypothetical protein